MLPTYTYTGSGRSRALQKEDTLLAHRSFEQKSVASIGDITPSHNVPKEKPKRDACLTPRYKGCPGMHNTIKQCEHSLPAAANPSPYGDEPSCSMFQACRVTLDTTQD